MKTYDLNWRENYRSSFQALSFRQQLHVLWWAFWGTRKFYRFMSDVRSGVSVPRAYERAKG